MRSRDASAGTTATFSQTGLGTDEGLTVVVGVPPGTDRAPTRNRSSNAGARSPTRSRSGSNTVLPAIVVALVDHGRRSFALAWRRGRDRRFTGSAVDAAFGNDTGAEERVGLGREDAGPVEFVPPDGVLPGPGRHARRRAREPRRRHRDDRRPRGARLAHDHRPRRQGLRAHRDAGRGQGHAAAVRDRADERAVRRRARREALRPQVQVPGRSSR